MQNTKPKSKQEYRVFVDLHELVCRRGHIDVLASSLTQAESIVELKINSNDFLGFEADAVIHEEIDGIALSYEDSGEGRHKTRLVSECD